MDRLFEGSFVNAVGRRAATFNRDGTSGA